MTSSLAFSTLGCPAWPWPQILDRASEYGYQGIELRGIQDEMDLTKTPPFAPRAVGNTKRELADRNLAICCVDSSCRLHELAGDAGLDDARRHIDLAAELGAPSIRVFGDRIPAEESSDAVIERIAGRLDNLGTYAEGTGVSVLIESHGDFSESAPLLALMTQVHHTGIGVLWDSHHPYRMYGEPIGQTYRGLQRWIRHVHVKDSLPSDQGPRYVLPGTGDVPLAEILGVLRDGGYCGWLSLEWEKRWHPDIAEPESAFPAFVQVIRELEHAAS